MEVSNPHDEYAAPALLERIRAAGHVAHSRLPRARDMGLLVPLQKVCINITSAALYNLDIPL